MLNVSSGIVLSNLIRQKRYSNLEHGMMAEINGIILHQTNSAQSFPTLLAYLWREVGAHFLISPAGIIYQTARIDRVCHHIGAIKSMCRQTITCTPEEDRVIDDLWNPALSVLANRMKLHMHESNKPPRSRYPTNRDSIGIEVVGASNGRVYQAPTEAQNFWSRWLINQLLSTLRLERTHVYTHGQVSYKLRSEAEQVQY